MDDIPTKKTAKMTKPLPGNLRATPEVEDFAHKYTEEGSGKVGGKLIDNYFKNVADLIITSGVTQKKKAKAVEIGCGEGFSTQRLAAMLPKGVTLSASEYVKAMIPRAKKNNPGIAVIEESAYELTYKDKSIDMIFLLEVLEHLDYPDKALAEIARVLKPDGFLVLGVPREPLWCMLNMARGKYLKHFGNTPGHLNHWSTLTLQAYLMRHFGTLKAVRTPLPWTLVLAQPHAIQR
jgi:ubiquinone/menaquinone biosynthesis C-methylase UbiE